MSDLKKTIKAGLGRIFYGAGLHRVVLRDTAAVIAFHRVSDDAQGSSINCPPAVFEELCRFFKCYFDVISLSELLGRLQKRERIDGALVITFDDGYKDNYTVAAPILQRLQLPATFFVATNFIGSQTWTSWDRHDGVSSEWMTWDDVQGLAKQGFDIGGHTMNHVDLAATETQEAAREIQGCRDTLAERLGIAVRHFAYPFGGPGNIDARATELVASSGFDCCLSCHGGVVTADDGVFRLRREPINSWVESPFQYGFELLLEARRAER